MRKTLLLPGALALMGVSGLSLAQEHGLVLSSTPVVQQVPVPRQVCSTEQIAVQPPKSGAGAAIGAIAGGAIGNAATGGSAAGTVLGVIGGSVVGDRVEDNPPAQLRSVQRCGMQTVYENRTVGYRVVYSYGDKEYTVQLPYDPGATIPLQVNPANLGMANAPPPQPIVTAPVTVYGETQVVAPVVVAPPVVPIYYLRSYPYYSYYGYPYPPVTIRYYGGYRRYGYGYHHRR